MSLKAYADAGVNYDMMDPFKIQAQRMAATTSDNAKRLGVKMFESSRGESTSLFQSGRSVFAHTEEGLGTKCLVTDAVYRATTLAMDYGAISHDAVAMIVNDLATIGASPVMCAMHLAVGDSDWFKDEARATWLLRGFAEACNMAGCIWGGGETPVLKDIVVPGTFVLSGSAVGKLLGRPLLERNVLIGDAIVFLTSSGIHANGLTLARKIAAKISPDPDRPERGYLVPISAEGPTYGQALLAPTHIYCRFVEMCIAEGVGLHYCANITGHGLKKLMRPRASFHYEIENLPEVPRDLEFIQEKAGLSNEEAYQTFNMGVGYALYVSPRDVDRVLRLCEGQPFQALYAGRVLPSPDKGKKVILKPVNVEYTTLGIR